MLFHLIVLVYDIEMKKPCESNEKNLKEIWTKCEWQQVIDGKQMPGVRFQMEPQRFPESVAVHSG